MSVDKKCFAILALSVLANMSCDLAVANEGPYWGMSLGISKTHRVQNTVLPIVTSIRSLPAHATTELDFKKGGNAQIMAGYAQANVRTEFEAVTFYSKYKTLKNAATAIDFSCGRTKALSALFNVYYDIDAFHSPLYPFLGLGAGVAMIKNRLRLPDDTANVLEKKFAYQGTMGLAFKVAAKMSLNMDYRYFATQRLKAFDKRLKNQSLNVGFLYHF